jgi:hypothetical protein
MRKILGSALIVGVVLSGPLAAAQPVIPPVWDVVADDFEGGSLAAWNAGGAQSAGLLPGSGHGGSTGLAVPVGQDNDYLYQTGVARAEEGYLSFWFNPNNVAIPQPTPNWWPPGSSICIASVVSSQSWWPPLVSLYVRHEAGAGYRGFITWPEGASNHYDYENEFDIASGWQRITIGYRVDVWAAVWIDDQLVRYDDASVSHQDAYGDVIYVGKVNQNSDITPSGTMLYDDVAFQVPRVDDLWVDAEHGDDEDDGLSELAAFATIQRAADLAGPGTTVHVLPGVYRETVHPALSGSAAEPVVYRAEDGPGTAIIRGSEPASDLTWTQLTSNPIGLPAGMYPNVYYADLSTWDLDGPPRFVVELTSPPPLGGIEGGQRLPLAREPDWEIVTEWKTHEFWWAADGGASPTACDPATDPDPNCDYASRSTTQLTDRTSDGGPIEPGNLTALGDLTGGTLVAIDTLQGHYVYRRTITAHDVGAGRITVDRLCEHDGGTGNPGLGWGSKYYVENKPALLDTPGEWWYDAATQRLYLWPPAPGDPGSQNIEISRRDNGFSLRNRSYLTLDGLTIELLDGSAVYLANWETHKAYGDTVRNVTLRYANWGVYVEQSVRATSPPENVIDGFTLEDSEIAYMDTLAVRLIDWWENGAAADSFTRPGVLNTVIRDNEMHHLGFRTDGDNAVGMSFTHANKLRFEGNYVHHVAHNGVQFSKSVIQSPKEYGFAPGEIKTGEILIKDNVFEKACQLTTDCGGVKFWGSAPDGHVFRDVLITGNVFRDSFGWTYISEKRGRWSGGEGSQVQGMGAFGLYVDHASGISAYRNVAYNNAYTGYMFSGRWRDGRMVYVNNVAANGLYGFSLGGSQYDTHGSVDTRLVNNVVIDNEAFGMAIEYVEGWTANMTVDHNLYYGNGWGGMWHAGPMVVRQRSSSGLSWEPQQTLADVQANTPWEDHGVAGDPAFWDYDPADHAMHDGSWPDFHLTSGSANAIDRGTVQLPASLTVLLDAFDVDDYTWGAALDVGRYEAGFAVIPAPASQAIEVGGMAHYGLSLYPPDLPHAVTLTLSAPPPGLSCAPSSDTLAPGAPVTLTVTHDGSAAGVGTWQTISIVGDGGGFTRAVEVRVLVGGQRVYLPIVLKSD